MRKLRTDMNNQGLNLSDELFCLALINGLNLDSGAKLNVESVAKNSDPKKHVDSQEYWRIHNAKNDKGDYVSFSEVTAQKSSENEDYQILAWLIRISKERSLTQEHQKALMVRITSRIKYSINPISLSERWTCETWANKNSNMDEEKPSRHNEFYTWLSSGKPFAFAWSYMSMMMKYLSLMKDSGNSRDENEDWLQRKLQVCSNFIVQPSAPPASKPTERHITHMTMPAKLA